jgi:hypothetical protein
LVSRTDRPVDDGLWNTCPILAKVYLSKHLYGRTL